MQVTCEYKGEGSHECQGLAHGIDRSMTRAAFPPHEDRGVMRWKWWAGAGGWYTPLRWSRGLCIFVSTVGERWRLDVYFSSDHGDLGVVGVGRWRGGGARSFVRSCPSRPAGDGPLFADASRFEDAHDPRCAEGRAVFAHELVCSEEMMGGGGGGGRRVSSLVADFGVQSTGWKPRWAWRRPLSDQR